MNYDDGDADLSKYNLLHHFQLWFNESIFPCYENWKVTVGTKIRGKENTIWQAFCTYHSGRQGAQVCLEMFVHISFGR